MNSLHVFVLAALLFAPSAFAMSPAQPRVVECSGLPGFHPKRVGKHSVEFLELKDERDFAANDLMPENCDLATVDWEKEWVYLFRFGCIGIGDRFEVSGRTGKTLKIELQKQETESRTNPDVFCNLLAACSPQVAAVVLEKGLEVRRLKIRERSVPCP